MPFGELDLGIGLSAAAATPPLFTPAMMTQGPNGWWDAPHAEALTLVGGAVSIWADRAGNGNDLSQTTESRRPTTGEINGLRTILLDANVNAHIGGYVFWGNPTDENIPQSTTIIVGAAAPGNAQTSNHRFTCHVFGNAGISSDGRIRLGQNDENFTFSTPAEPSLVTYTANDIDDVTAAVGYFPNGGAEETTTLNWGDFPPNGFGYGFGGDRQTLVGEGLSFQRILSAAERQLVEGYAAHKWGLEANLPSGHPFKPRPPYAGDAI